MHLDKNTLLTWTVVIFLALLLAVPASYAVKKARNIDAAIPADVLSGMKADVPVVPITRPNATGLEVLTPGTTGAMYGNAGAAILTPTRANINTFAVRDFELVGEAPTALTNTVAANMQDPEILRYIFNNKTVVSGFINRPDVRKILADPKGLFQTASDENALSNFFNDPMVRAAFASPKIVETVANSMLTDAVLQSPSAQYFIKNPKTANALITKSPTLAALKTNPAVSAAVRNNKRTAAVAAILLK